MNIKKYLVVIPGIILAFVLYTLSQGFNNILGIELLGYEKSPISTAMIAILLGMFFGNVFQIRESFLRGLDFTQSAGGPRKFMAFFIQRFSPVGRSMIFG